MVYVIVLLAVLARFLPHTANFSPVYGATLFAGARLRPRDSVWFPLSLLALSDIVLTTRVYHMRLDWMEPVQWVAYAALALIGRWVGKRFSLGRLIGAAAAAAVAFFLISNLGVWLTWRMYPATVGGLLDCYVAGLPFFRYTLASSLLYSVLLFGAYELYSRRLAHPSRREQAEAHEQAAK